MDRSTVCRLSHSATVTLGARSTSRTCLSGFSDRRLDRNGLPGELGGRGGNRTGSLARKKVWSGKLGSNQRPLDYRSSAQTTLSFSRLYMQRVEPRARFELAFPDYRSGASPTMLTRRVILEPMERIERSSVACHATALSLNYTGWSRRADSNRHLSVTTAPFFH